MSSVDDTARDLLLTGIRNAHAMERQAEELIERQVERMSEYPQVQERLRLHLEETREQMRRLEDILDRYGTSASSLKDAALSVMGNMAAMGHALAGDEVLKNTFANNAFEHYEIAAYKSLLTMSEHLGADVSEQLQQSLHEEEQMAAWVEDHVREITLSYMEKEQRAA